MVDVVGGWKATFFLTDWGGVFGCGTLFTVQEVDICSCAKKRKKKLGFFDGFFVD